MEHFAAEFLRHNGLEDVSHNYHVRGGEIDLIMRDNEYLVFIEVRYRRNNSHGSAMESITPAKQRRLIKAAQVYLQRTNISSPSRFDIVAMGGQPPHQLTFDWIKSAFDSF